MQKLELVIDVLKTFNKNGILDDLVLIGSWTHFFYRIHFDDAPEIPAVRTLDIDFLVPNPRAIKKEVNIGDVLKKLNFTSRREMYSGIEKFGHPDLDLEFLSPLLSAGVDIARPIPKLKTHAVGLRYLEMLAWNTITVKHKSLMVNVPEPSAYVLHKFLISAMRFKEEKRKKDQDSALKMATFLLKQPEQKDRLQKVFESMFIKWRKKVLKVIEEVHPELATFLKPHINNPRVGWRFEK
ncbi:MAG: hypothetical protein HQK83_04215 [Fibrobacteria bacterium]|nr:hypothetical protein [Fibrobacteria bacterium]